MMIDPKRVPNEKNALMRFMKLSDSRKLIVLKTLPLKPAIMAAMKSLILEGNKDINYYYPIGKALILKVKRGCSGQKRKRDWCNLSDVKDYARQLGGGCKVIKHPDRNNYNIIPSQRPDLEKGVEVIFVTVA